MGTTTAERTGEGRPAGRAISHRHKLRFSGHVPALDGLRGLALVAVLLYHALPNTVRGGFLGVEMFFVLSGFLLTALLLDEHAREQAIDVLAYAQRRVRRIIPALFVLLAVLVVAVRLLAVDDAHRLPGDIISSLFGVTNWHLIADGSSYFAQTGRPPFVRHLWSIAVELQAYVMLPFVAILVTRVARRRAVLALLAGVATSAGLMAVLYASPDPSRAYYGTDTRMAALLSGALLASLLLKKSGVRRTQLTQRATILLGALAAVLLVFLFFAADQRGRWLYPAGFLCVQAATAGLIVSAMLPGRTSDLLSSPALRWLGTRSYGIYLWHWPIVVLIRPGVDVSWSAPVAAAVGIGAACVLGELSYRLVEQPFLLAKSWGRKPLPPNTKIASVVWVTATLLVVLMVSRTATVDPIARSLAEGERALAAQERSLEIPIFEDAPKTGSTTRATSRTASRPAIDPSRESPGKLPTVTGPVPGSVKLSAVGDSVMLGAASRMKKRFGKSSYINAETNRRYAQGATVVRGWRKADRLGRVLIVHLGNNGPANQAELDSIFKEAKPTSHIILVTVRVTKPWQNAVNDMVKKTAKKHEKVLLADWYATSRGHPEWFYSDATHMNSTGADAYTKLLAAKIPPASKPKPKPKTATPKPAPKPTPTPGLLDDLQP